jgi:hypothetical protein
MHLTVIFVTECPNGFFLVLKLFVAVRAPTVSACTCNKFISSNMVSASDGPMCDLLVCLCGQYSKCSLVQFA